MASIGTHISAIRGPLKLDVSDIRITDRDIYVHLVSGRDILVKRSDQKLQMMDKDHLFQAIGVELEEVDIVDVCLECVKFKSTCKIKRTKKKLPTAVEGEWGPIIFYISNLGGDKFFQEVTKQSYFRKIQKSTARYDKTLYYWFENGYLFFPNIEWDAVLVSAMWEDVESCDKTENCKNFQERNFNIPKDLIDPLYKMVWQVFGLYVQIPTKVVEDKNENT